MSQFCDQATVEFRGGKGGDGAVHFRREKFVSHGGPDGGDGGHGGNIVLLADENMNTLADFATKKIFRAEDGENGSKSHSSGKSGEEMVLKVPAGTLVKNPETSEILADLKEHGQSFVVARGGKGGFGNSHFKSSVHQAPNFAENGEEGEALTVLLELQLVADVGIIGFPSAGKSTLISRISNAKPKIADYPFTTLIPNLGVVEMQTFDRRQKDSFVVADIPGLIEGAHEGKGLGHEFLRHISRTQVLVHLVDITRQKPEDFEIINKELEEWNPKLAKKTQIVAVSKADTVLPEEMEAFKKKLIKKYPKLKKGLHVISSVSGEGIPDLVFEMYQKVGEIRKQNQEERAQEKAFHLSEEKSGEKLFQPHLKGKKFEVIFRRTKKEAATGKERKIFDVTGQRIEQVVAMTDTENPEGLERIYHFLNKMGIKKELQRHGAQPGDKVRISGKTFTMRQ